VDERLADREVRAVSPGGRKRLIRRFEKKADTVMVSAVVDDEGREVAVSEGIAFMSFLTDDKLLGVRSVKRKSEWVLFDVTTTTTTVLTPPVEAKGDDDTHPVPYPAPDGRRLLWVWSEEVPQPIDWPFPGNPCRATRLTVSDVGGKNGKTIYAPTLKTRADDIKYNIADLDWR
jgi:hypothetical protein